MGRIWTAESWARQPQTRALVAKPVGVVISGAFPRQNLIGNGKAFANTNPITSGQYGRAISFDRTTGAGLDTSFVPGTITKHSGILLVKHRDLSSLNTEAYISTRSVTNTGFGFVSVNADGSAPSRTFKLRYTHFSIADYDCTVAISGGDNAYVTVGFSASVNGVVRFFANGRFLQQISIGSMTANTNTVAIGHDPSTLGAKAHYDLPFCAYFSNRFLSDSEHAQYARNPWQLFTPQRRQFAAVISSGVTATLAPAQAADVAALGATVTNRASIAPTQAADTAALAATVTNRASIAATQAADIAALSALIQTNPAASIAATQAADTAALGATVTNRAQLAPQQAADTAAINVIAGSLDVAIAATQAPDSAAIVVQLPSRTGAGASRRGKRRRIVLGDQVYDVLERDLPTLLEAVMLNRKPPATAVVEPAQPAARAQEKSEPTQVEARAPLPSLDEARERYEAMLSDINRAATADVAALLQRVADRVLAELEDDEDAAVTLLLH